MAEKFDRVSHISHVHIEGYKSIDNLYVDLLPGLNILIGKNGSGKSNFVEVIHKSFLKTYQSVPRQINLTINTQKKNEIRWIYSNNSSVKDDKVVMSSIRNLLIGNKSVGTYFSPYVGDTLWTSVLPDLRKNKIDFFTLGKIYFDIPTVLKEGLNKNIALDSKGFGDNNSNFFWREIDQLLLKTFNIENVTHELIAKYLKFSKLLKDSLRRFSPIQDIRFSNNFNIHKEGKRTLIENIYPEFKIFGNWVPWSYLSDGTKRLFYLVYTICQSINGIFLIEEPELGVHPHQFFDIMTFLKEESKNKQIIIATHSPDALNILSADELDRIILTEYSSEKGTTMKHLSAAQKKKAKVYMDESGFLSDYWKHSDLEA